MKKISTAILGALGVVAFASACSVETMDAPSEEVGTSEEGLMCSNDQAVYSIMASMAVAASNEMKRWLPQRDLFWNTSVTPNRLDVATYGTARCPLNSAGVKECKVMKQLLSLQNDSAAGMQFGGQTLAPNVLRDRLKTYWDRQVQCANRPDNHAGDDCPVEYHDLAFSMKTTSSTTCNNGYDYWYHASKQGSNGTVLLQYPGQLKNMLIWAGYPENQFLGFDQQGDDVKIDPIDGTTGGTGSGSGSCEVATGYNASTGKCDNTNVDKTPTPAGSAYKCCVCGTQTRSWKPVALQAGYWTCKL
jgi:hypothetical protein